MKTMKRLIVLGAMVAAAGLLCVSCGGGGGVVAPSGQPSISQPDQDVPQLVDAPEADAALAALARGESLYEDDDEIKNIAANDTFEQGTRSAFATRQDRTTGASGGPSINNYYVPANAFDGNFKTWWAGKVNAKTWDLFYGMQAAHYLDSINMNFYGADYIPGAVDVYVSADGTQWNCIAKLKHSVKAPLKPLVVVGRNVRYIWIHMQGNPRSGFPLVREIEWTPVAERVGAYAAPGADDNWYFSSNMFDGDTNTQWAGKPGAGAWTIAYGFAQARFIGVVGVDLFSVNHKPADMELLLSNDGETWESLGSFGAVWPPAKFVGREAKYFKIVMTGNPLTGYPVVREITYGMPAGAFAAPNENEVSWPAGNLFDGNPNTWWVGKQQGGAWDVYYGYGAPTTVGTVTVHFYSVNHMPAATQVFTSSDGVTWTLAGTMPAGATPSLSVNATVKYVRICMAGNPYVGYPLIKDIAIQ